MKTITEFAATSLKNAIQTRKDLLAAGKTPEELPQAMGEALKLEGDKLALLLGAVELVEAKLQDLKRVVVLSPAEGEKPPQGAEQKGEHCFRAEYYPPLHPPKDKTRGKHADGGRKGKGRGGKRGERGGRGERRPPRGKPQGEGRAPGTITPRSEG